MRRRAALLLLALAAAAPLPPPHHPPAHPRQPAPPPASAGQLADQLAMLAFDANPEWATPERTVLSRWAGPLRLFVFGRPEDKADARTALFALERPTRLTIRLLNEHQVARTPPNAFIVADADLPGAFRGPLHAMLRQAFLDDESAVESFVATVVARTPCWVLPVWTDAGRAVLKAAVIGVDTRQPRAQIRACMLRGLGGALGLLGPGAFLPGSAFAPGGNGRLTRDDARMLRVLYGPALHPGMTRDEATAAATRAFAPPPRRKPAAHHK